MAAAGSDRLRPLRQGFRSGESVDAHPGFGDGDPRKALARRAVPLAAPARKARAANSIHTMIPLAERH